MKKVILIIALFCSVSLFASGMDTGGVLLDGGFRVESGGALNIK